MKEIEVKVIEINKEEMVKKILALNGKKVFEGRIVSHLYDFEDGSIKKGESILRLRKKGSQNLLAFKKKISEDRIKIVEELETEVKDFEIVDQILKGVGLDVKRISIKKRTSYDIHGTLVEIEEIEDVPTFMEIESSSVEKVFEMIEKLDIDKNKVKTWTGEDVLKHYDKNDERTKNI